MSQPCLPVARLRTLDRDDGKVPDLTAGSMLELAACAHTAILVAVDVNGQTERILTMTESVERKFVCTQNKEQMFI